MRTPLVTRDLPRIVNATWLERALTEQADATEGERVLPWDPVDLLERAAHALRVLRSDVRLGALHRGLRARRRRHGR